ncbi:MAG: hypothetical protein B7X36_00250 [Thiomonas sp. 14-64-326]|jgi:hypothetical protein|uniref:hypothetical protein n=1 Tax=Thiomonas sp. TaxID=2047785 RepID=UPI000BC4611B|nr:hypothetical protein [Thiomonas sp.]OZB77369.1 MAG: hypothetical protein B7X36_00250 [Thiomonas sp. 14-64-326]
MTPGVKPLMWAALGLAVASALMAGCAGPQSAVQVQMLAPAGSSNAPQSLVQVLTAAPESPYAEVARLSITGAPGMTAAQLIDALQKKAGALGANALVVDVQTQTGPAQLQFNSAGGQYETQPGISVVDVKALAIRMKAAAAAPEQAPVKP